MCVFFYLYEYFSYTKLTVCNIQLRIVCSLRLFSFVQLFNWLWDLFASENCIYSNFMNQPRWICKEKEERFISFVCISFYIIHCALWQRLLLQILLFEKDMYIIIERKPHQQILWAEKTHKQKFNRIAVCNCLYTYFGCCPILMPFFAFRM